MSFGAEARARLAVLPVCALMFPWRCSLGLPLADRGDTAPPAAERGAPPAVSAATEKREVLPQRVSSGQPPPPRAHVITLPEEVVLKVMGAGQRQFLRCWTKAQQDDPVLDSAKVRLHLDIDAAGRVTSVKADTAAAGLARCLGGVARQLRFPAPGRPAVVDVPLMFP